VGEIGRRIDQDPVAVESAQRLEVALVPRLRTDLGTSGDRS
jgi:hypothetical protein